MSKEMLPVFDQEKFEEEIQKTLDKFELPPQTRRQIFLLLMEDADKQQAQKKAFAILNDKTSELTETSE
jgi:hypothetical protein